MNNENKTNEKWQDLFDRLPEERPSDDFRNRMMDKIRREAARAQRRNERMAWIAVSLGSMVMIAMAVAAFIFMKTPKITFRMPSFTPLSFNGISFYLFIGALALLLLILDNQVRKSYRKRHG